MNQTTLLVHNTYCFQDKFYCSLRLIRNYSRTQVTDDDSTWKNFSRVLHTFFTDELKHQELDIRYDETIEHYTTDEEGWLHLQLRAEPLARQNYCFTVYFPEIDVTIPVATTPLDYNDARTIVISDLDDTVIQSWVNMPLKMYSKVLFGNPHTRDCVPGMVTVYNRLQDYGAKFIYISKTPINMYQDIVEFLQFHRLPIGLIYLRQFGISKICDAPFDSHRDFKTFRIESLQPLLSNRKVLLFGDSSEKDCIIYQKVTQQLHLDALILIRLVPPNHQGTGASNNSDRVVYFEEPPEVIAPIENFLGDSFYDSVS